MIVDCNELSEFIGDLKNHSAPVVSELPGYENAPKPSMIYQDMVRVTIQREPLLDKASDNPRDAVRHRVFLKATAVVRAMEGGEYLLRYVFDCGKDYSDASPDTSGSKLAAEAKEQIELVCKELGLKVGPGEISI